MSGISLNTFAEYIFDSLLPFCCSDHPLPFSFLFFENFVKDFLFHNRDDILIYDSVINRPLLENAGMH